MFPGKLLKYKIVCFLNNFYLTASLGEYKLRDLNDDINKLLREKKHWDEHIKNLGGPDFEVISH